MKFEAICRVCLEEGDLKSVFTTNCLSNQLSCAEAIMKFSSILIKENDGLPNKICKKCLSKLKAAHKFRILCEDSNAKLFEHMSVSNSFSVKREFKTLGDECYSNFNYEISFSNQKPINQSNMNIDFQNKNCSNENPTDFSIKANLSQQNDSNLGCESESKNTNIEESKVNLKSNKFEIMYSKKNQDKSKLFYCKLCNVSFINILMLNEHKSRHESQKETNGCNLQAQSDKQFQCEFCAKIFLRASTLRTHLLAHKRELPFRCSYPGCEKAFPLNSRLKLHQKVHTDERNFICQYCSHAARDKQQLTVHIRYLHTKEKNFVCGTCGKGFVSAQARYYHTKRHENIRNHHCPHCDRSFVFAFGLREHLVTHTGEKRFSCSSCDARFSRKAHKIKHEMRIHGINEPSSKRTHSFMTMQMN